MLTTLLDLLFPINSLTGVEGTWLTEEERTTLKCGRSTIVILSTELKSLGCTALDEVRAVMKYSSTPLLHHAIHAWKYRSIRAFDALMKELLEGLEQPMDLANNTVICPVPLHWSRAWNRGFNQAEILATSLAASWNIDCRKLLKRTRPTGHQAHRDREERWSALSHAFMPTEEHSLPSAVILVDDIFTTGATLQECARTLKKAGVKHVRGVVLARG